MKERKMSEASSVKSKYGCTRT